ncbi:hypothetical protein SAMN04487783_2782 [Agrococcus baldri]|uniref:Uncharacterized protein n=1 Tax=Agrococcus baldri TaxID=153730 RepID=A0AA94L0S5_9MICO|nr:hypothetical protein SAMN04487783_2782 [Agrococcus baldri]
MRKWLITTVATAVVGFIIKRLTESDADRSARQKQRRR